MVVKSVKGANTVATKERKAVTAKLPAARSATKARRSVVVPSAAKPPPNFADKSLHGYAVLSRHGGEAIEQVSSKGITLFFSSGSVPQLRLRRPRPGEVDEFPERDRLVFSVFRRDFLEWRTVVMMRFEILLKSGKHRAILERHPDHPLAIIDETLDDWRNEIRSAAHGETGRNAMRAARNSKALMERFEDFLASAVETARHEARERVQWETEVVNHLERIADQQPLTERQRILLGRLQDDGMLKEVEWQQAAVELVRSICAERTVSPEQQKLVDRLLENEKFKILYEEKNRRTAADLERSRVGG
ncbi:hypothetical protein [Paracraurococcus lichenis]|uniref:Uncharacterized protein n=1 Tax=Paracraurococcus lichenis TaxID=3064888 RepID=A0ABT9EAD2_9PROT|nr:hypothetical protein [Paracraurococcus sp. LOR1-02]MDO9713162.1 hypothetical protein [Paracraurococcus sp. LOR1-02]